MPDILYTYIDCAHDIHAHAICLHIVLGVLIGLTNCFLIKVQIKKNRLRVQNCIIDCTYIMN